MTRATGGHRLAAILFADVVGYSRLIGTDESGTLATFRRRRQHIVEPLAAEFRGRIVKLMGDGILAEFGSAVDAVDFALRLQQGFAEANRDEGGPPMALRVGINLGEVAVEGDDIHGDGVNVAARLEGQAPEGGLAISEAVHAQVRGKVPAQFLHAGDLALKNIATRVGTWTWAPDRAGGPAAPDPAGEDDTPSIAVLPFANMSGDAEQEYFSDGISEDIITDLSRLSGLLVVARNSTFAYKGRNVDVRQIGRDLGVRSVLEGSVRRAGNRLRITAQLIDAQSGGHLWAERYDRDLTDIFAVQDEVTLQIVGALRLRLKPAERSRIDIRATNDLDAHDRYLMGREMMHRLLNAGSEAPTLFERTLARFEEALAFDPSYGAAHGAIAHCWVWDFYNGWTGAEDPLGNAERAVARGLAVDPDEPYLHYASAVASLARKDLPRALASARRALELSPNFAMAYGTYGNCEIAAGNTLGAIPYFERAMRLDTGYAPHAMHFIGVARVLAGQYEEAVAILQKRIEAVPNTDITRMFLACALGHLGRTDEARTTWQALMAVNPNYVLEKHLARMPFGSPAQQDLIRQGLARAGLPG